MAPLEIPGTSVSAVYPMKDNKCPDPECGKDFTTPKKRSDGDHCPWCDLLFKEEKSDSSDKNNTMQTVVTPLGNKTPGAGDGKNNGKGNP